MARKPARMLSRRRAYSASIVTTVSMLPRIAARAAYCVIEFGFEVDWLCSFATASTSGFGARTYPMRHPVMAKVFENDPAIIVCSFEPGTLAIENGFASPYVKCE